MFINRIIKLPPRKIQEIQKERREKHTKPKKAPLKPLNLFLNTNVRATKKHRLQHREKPPVNVLTHFRCTNQKTVHDKK